MSAPRHFLDLDAIPALDLRAILDEAHRRKAARRGLPRGARDADERPRSTAAQEVDDLRDALLPAAALTDEGDDFALLDVEADIADCAEFFPAKSANLVNF